MGGGVLTVVDWLLDSDPSVRWQVMRDLTDAPAEEVAAERARIATEGAGARLLALQAADGRWGGAAWNRGWDSTMHVLALLREMGLDGPATRPGIVVSIATSGDLLQWHPHGHTLVTDGAFSDDGAFHSLETWDAEAVMKLFRERLLARLTLRHAISEHLARKLLAWRHPGFSAHLGEAIPFDDRKAIEDVACYVVRNPLSLKKLVYLDGQKAVLYRSKMNPSLGRNFEAMDPLEWLARMADHIPDAGRHRTRFYGFYASRVRASRRETQASHVPAEPAPAKRRCSPSWARLISKLYQADPLVCKGCGGPLKIVAYINDQISIKRILGHLGLSPQQQEKPPPTREVLRVPVDDEGREILAG